MEFWFFDSSAYFIFSNALAQWLTNGQCFTNIIKLQRLHYAAKTSSNFFEYIELNGTVFYTNFEPSMEWNRNECNCNSVSGDVSPNQWYLLCFTWSLQQKKKKAWQITRQEFDDFENFNAKVTHDQWVTKMRFRKLFLLTDVRYIMKRHNGGRYFETIWFMLTKVHHSAWKIVCCSVHFN